MIEKLDSLDSERAIMMPKLGPAAPPTDSDDECYMHHDNCYDSIEANRNQCPVGASIMSCDADLVACLKRLPDEPTKWPSPPRSGTEGDSKAFRRGAILWF